MNEKIIELVSKMYPDVKISQHPNFQEVIVLSNGKFISLKNGRPVEAYKGKFGYYILNLFNTQKDKWDNKLAHKIIWEAFNGIIPSFIKFEGGIVKKLNMQIDHIDGDKSNFSLDNLQLLTPSENVKKSYVQVWGLQYVTCPYCNSRFRLTPRYYAHLNSCSKKQ